MAGMMGARELANVAYGVAPSCMAVSLGVLFVALAKVAERHLGKLKP